MVAKTLISADLKKILDKYPETGRLFSDLADVADGMIVYFDGIPFESAETVELL